MCEYRRVQAIVEIIAVATVETTATHAAMAQLRSNAFTEVEDIDNTPRRKTDSKDGKEKRKDT